ncbi:hypothetical protein SAM19_03026 [Brevibacillus laterosporus]|nr:hypothetical protein [Brevibacillus laterosporus]
MRFFHRFYNPSFANEGSRERLRVLSVQRRRSKPEMVNLSGKRTSTGRTSGESFFIEATKGETCLWAG